MFRRGKAVEAGLVGCGQDWWGRVGHGGSGLFWKVAVRSVAAWFGEAWRSWCGKACCGEARRFWCVMVSREELSSDGLWQGGQVNF